MYLLVVSFGIANINIINQCMKTGFIYFIIWAISPPFNFLINKYKRKKHYTYYPELSFLACSNITYSPIEDSE